MDKYNFETLFDNLKDIIPDEAIKEVGIDFDSKLGYMHVAKKVISLLIEWNFEQLELISDAFTDIKKLDFINTISEIKKAQKTFEMSKGISDERRRFDCISESQFSLNKAIAELEQKAMFYIKKQHDIDDMSYLKKIFRGRSVIKEIDSNNSLAKTALQGLMAAVSLQISIAKCVGDDIRKSVVVPYENFKNQLLSEDTGLFMNEYDKNYSDEFWVNLSKSMDTLKLAAEFIEAENEVDFICYKNE